MSETPETPEKKEFIPYIDRPIKPPQTAETTSRGGKRRGAGRPAPSKEERALRKLAKGFSKKSQRELLRAVNKLPSLSLEALKVLAEIMKIGEDSERRQAAQTILKHTIPEQKQDTGEQKNTMIVYMPEKSNTNDWNSRAKQILDHRTDETPGSTAA